MGHIDFYAIGLRPHPNGCTSPICAHMRSVDYLVEFLYPGKEGGFTACLPEQCTGHEYIMGTTGLLYIRDAIFALDVNPAPPFGKSSKSKYGTKRPYCGLCPVQSYIK